MLFVPPDEFEPPDEAAAFVVGDVFALEDPPHAATTRAELTTSTLASALPRVNDQRGLVESVVAGDSGILKFLSARACWLATSERGPPVSPRLHRTPQARDCLFAACALPPAARTPCTAGLRGVTALQPQARHS
jgi:hypothetical protein